MAETAPAVSDAHRFGGRADWIHTAANALGLAVTAGAGILVSVLLANLAGASAVGQVNQLAAIYIVGSQFAAFGVQMAILYLVPITPEAERPTVARAALVSVLPSAMVSGLAVLVLAPGVEALLDSPGLGAGLNWVAPAVGLFGLNKLLFALLNVFGHLIWLAAAQAARPLVWLGAVLWQARAGGLGAEHLGAMFLYAEVLVLVLTLMRLAPHLARPSTGRTWPWIRRCLHFGVRALPSNAVTEINTRVDVLILGAFATDAAVGIYSFAALMAEGLLQIGVFLRVIVNNRVVAVVVARDQAGILRLRREVGQVALAASAGAAALALLITPWGIDAFGLDPALHQGWPILVMMSMGVVAGSGYAPFWNILLLAGRPGAHSVLMVAILLWNVLLNGIAVPLAGMLGAGAATAIMFLSFPAMLRFASRRVLGLGL